LFRWPEEAQVTVDLSFRRLEAFVGVATLGNYSDAAEKLYVSQSAISRRIQDLEKELGTRLLDRGSRHVDLTPEGREFLGIAQSILEARERGIEQFKRYQQGLVGTLTIATIPTVAATLLPGLVRTFITEHPSVAVRITDGPDRTLYESVRSGEADFAIAAVLPEPTLQADLRVRPLLSDPFCAVFQRDHDLAQRQAVAWEELARQPLVSLTSESGVRVLIDHAFSNAGLQIDEIVEATSISTVEGLIVSGLGVAALPALVFNLLSGEELVHRPLVDPILRRTIALITPRSGQLSPIASSFASMIARKEGPPPSGSAWHAGSKQPFL
jgi:LysR family carnitine catabolism transcriptional activator